MPAEGSFKNSGTAAFLHNPHPHSNQRNVIDVAFVYMKLKYVLRFQHGFQADLLTLMSTARGKDAGQVSPIVEGTADVPPPDNDIFSSRPG